MNLQRRKAVSPAVSIVIDNFNYGRFLGACIQSALAQTYEHCEVLVVDDGSTDHSRDIIESFGSRIRSIFKANAGQGSAYNVGFAAASGDLIHFLDADDILLPEAIEEVVALWEPGVSKIHFYLQVVEGVNATPTLTLLPTCTLAEGDLARHTLKCGHYNSPPATGNTYARESLAEIFPMPEAQWITSADTYPIFLSAFLGRIRSCHKPLGLYRVHGNNQDAQTTITPKLLRYRYNKELMRDQMFLEFAESHDLPYERGAVFNHLGHMKIRLASLLLDRASHPVATDTIRSVAWKTAKLGFLDRGSTLRKRLLVVAWVASLLMSPRSTRHRLIEVGFVPTKRPGLLQWSMKPK